MIEREIAATDSDCLVGEKIVGYKKSRVESSGEMERRAANRLEQSRGFQHIDRGNWRILTLHVFLLLNRGTVPQCDWFTREE